MSGNESIFNLGYIYDFSRDSFGIRTPEGAVFNETLRAIRCFIYVWRDEEDYNSGLFEFLDFLADYVLSTYHVDNLAYIEKMLDSIERPKNISDVYAVSNGRYLLKAYLGDPKNKVEEMEFITQANVLLGLSYL